MIRETFLAPLYTLRVGSLGAAHVARVTCMCGAGPWFLHSFWLRQWHSENEFLRWIMGGLTCPKCGQRDCMAWVGGRGASRQSGSGNAGAEQG